MHRTRFWTWSRRQGTLSRHGGHRSEKEMKFQFRRRNHLLHCCWSSQVHCLWETALPFPWQQRSWRSYQNVEMAREGFPGRWLDGHVGNDTRIPCYIDLLSRRSGKRQEELEPKIVHWFANVDCFLVVPRDLENLGNHEGWSMLNLYGRIGSFFHCDNRLETGKSNMPGEPW